MSKEDAKLEYTVELDADDLAFSDGSGGRGRGPLGFKMSNKKGSRATITFSQAVDGFADAARGMQRAMDAAGHFDPLKSTAGTAGGVDEIGDDDLTPEQLRAQLAQLRRINDEVVVERNRWRENWRKADKERRSNYQKVIAAAFQLTLKDVAIANLQAVNATLTALNMAAPVVNSGGLPDGVDVIDLLKLCHPDRHMDGANEGRANDVTKALIKYRDSQ